MRPSLFVLLFSCFFQQWVSAALSSEELFALQIQQETNGVIYLDPSNIDQILNGPRDYYISLLFTSLDPTVNCANCQKFDDKYKIVANSYYSSNPDRDDIFFLIAEFPLNKPFFGKLNMNTVPILWVYPPNSTESSDVSNPHFQYQIGAEAMNDAINFANFIGQITGAGIVLSTPFDPLEFAKYFGATFLVVLLLKKKVLSKIGLASSIKIGITILINILISGYMFVVIRGIPFISRNENGGIMFFSGGTHWQFGTETAIIASLYSLLVILIFGLVVTLPKVENDKRKGILTIVTAFAVFYIFNYLTSIFAIKDPDYPYQLAKWLNV